MPAGTGQHWQEGGKNYRQTRIACRTTRSYGLSRRTACRCRRHQARMNCIVLILDAARHIRVGGHDEAGHKFRLRHAHLDEIEEHAHKPTGTL
jgi:hypothetical protein